MSSQQITPTHDPGAYFVLYVPHKPIIGPSDELNIHNKGDML